MPSHYLRTAASDLASQSVSHDVSTDDERAQSMAIQVTGLSKRFGSGEPAVTAVDNVSFSVERGQIVGLLGPNGAGKTTIIKAMLGLVKPDAGSVEIAGIDVFSEPKKAYQHVEAMMEGARNHYWRLTVRENLEYFAAISGENPKEIRGRHTELLEALDLIDFEHEQVRNVSRGMKQKVAIASALARDVDVVFLDEPTLGLDIESSITFRRSLRDLAADRGITVIISSHDMNVIEDICDRVVIINHGRVIADDRVEAVLDMFDTQSYRISVRDIELKTLRANVETVDFDTVTDADGRIQIEVTADSDTFFAFMAELSGLGARLDSVESLTPDLEEVFVTLTAGEKQ